MLLFAFLSTILSATTTQASPALQAGIHGRHTLTERVDLSGHLIFCNLVEDNSAAVYLGPRINLSEKVWVEPLLGQSLYQEDNSFILTPRIYYKDHGFTVWADLEFSLQTAGWFNLLDAKYTVYGPVSLGLEGKNYGGYEDFTASYFSLGPGVKAQLGDTLSLDAAYYFATDRVNVFQVSVGLYF